MATIVLTSPACQASAQRAAMSLTAASPRSRSTVCWVGAAEPIALRARCSALLTAAVDVSSCSATSAAEKPSTSRRISAARWVARQVLQRRDVREFDGLAGKVVRLGRDVGAGLEPADFGRRGASRDADGQLTPAALLDGGEAPVSRDLVEPCADETALVEAADAAPRARERVLHRILGVVQGAEHPVAVGLQLAAVRRYQLLEGAGVAGARGIDQRGGARSLAAI